MANQHYVLITILTLTCLDMELVFAIKQYFQFIHAFNVHPRTGWLSEQHTLQHGSNWIIICRFIARCSINITSTKTKGKTNLLPVVVHRSFGNFEHVTQTQTVDRIPFIFMPFKHVLPFNNSFFFIVSFQHDGCLCEMTLERIMLSKYWYCLHFYYNSEPFWILCDRRDIFMAMF